MTEEIPLQLTIKSNTRKLLIDNVKGLKIGVPKEFFGEGIHTDVEKAVWDAIHKYESLGATWEEVSMPNIRYALASYYIIAMSEASSNLARFDGTRYGFRRKWRKLACYGFKDQG